MKMVVLGFSCLPMSSGIQPFLIPRQRVEVSSLAVMDKHIRLGALPKCLAAAPPFWAIAAPISTYDQGDEARSDDLPRDAVESVFGVVGVNLGAYLKAA